MKRGAYPTSYGPRRQGGSAPTCARHRLAFLVGALTFTSVSGLGCTTAVSSAAGSFVEPLSRAILEHDDPETVREGVPALLLVIDALIEADPGNSGNLQAGARLYGTYAVSFAGTP